MLYNGDEPHREQFMRRVCRLGIPTPIAFLPRYTVQEPDVQRMLDASLAYLRAHAFRVSAEKLPQVSLRSWTAQPAQERYADISSMDNVAAVFLLDDSNIRLKALAYALAVHANFRVDPECLDAGS
ncbi:MAG: hypothetical protein K2I59_04510, partial [Alistipes sp.]|nr:hypothetical protein [Alistipes sp.]